MGNQRRQHEGDRPPERSSSQAAQPAPLPTTVFRRRAWMDFQRALDPLAPPKPLPRVRP